ncbi:MAG: DUF742 domain-containing protein [Acidimicrobiales bacterium]
MTDLQNIDDGQGPPSSLRVRPYTVTGGRTKADIELEIETMIQTTTQTASSAGGWQTDSRGLISESRALLELCVTPLSIAEISAHLRLPLQVIKVLVGDLVIAKRVATHGAAPETGARPDLALLERVLDGLQSL